MRAIVLAAGAGRRMRPLTDRVHKGMLPIGDTTILARLVDGLAAIGADPITVVVGHRADEVRGYLERRCPGPAYDFVHSPRWATTNNIVSLALALDRPGAGDEDVVLTECDVLLGPGVLPRLAGEGRGNLALVDHYRPGMDGTVVTVRDDHVDRLFTADRQGPDFDFRGTFKTLNVYRFTGEFCARTLAPALRHRDGELHDGAYYEAVLARLDDLARHRIAAEVVAGAPWAEVDDPNDLMAARFVFEPDRRAEILDAAHGAHWNHDLVDHGHMRNAHFPPPALTAALQHALPALLASYGSTQAALDAKLALVLECDPGRVVALNGAAQAYPWLGDSWAGRRVAVPTPTFGEYARVFPDAQTYAEGLDDAALDALAAAVDLLVVVSPNNPTGRTRDTASLHALARRHPATHLLVDESFVAFSDQEPLRRRLERDPLPNVTVLCSLSKVLGMPGARLGYLYATAPAVLDMVRERLPIWNLNAVAEHVLELLPKFRRELDVSLARTRADRDALRGLLLAVPGVSDVAPSGGDFLLVTLDGPPDTGRRVREWLLAGHAIDVKDIGGRFADGRPRLRVGLRTGPENAALAAAVDDALRAVA